MSQKPLLDRPLCFVVMPYDQKPDPKGGSPIDFNGLFERAVRPAIEAAGLEPIRSDLERQGGMVHRAMLERLLLCEFVVADLTTANANVFYELGVRHAARPATTLPIIARGHGIPFDLAVVQALVYDLGPDNQVSDGEAALISQALTARLQDLRDGHQKGVGRMDSPLFSLVSEWEPKPLSREKTEAFLTQVQLDKDRRRKLQDARRKSDAEGREALKRLASSWITNADAELSCLVELFLSFRAVKAWEDMVAFYEKLPKPLQRQVMMREQLALALNRIAEKTGEDHRRDDAIQILQGVLERQGPSAETCGILGRVHKSRWQAHRQTSPDLARAARDQAIEAYRAGANADLRDVYPAINLATLLSIRAEDGDQAEAERRLTVLEVALQIRGDRKDYWDYATLLEAAILRRDLPAGQIALGRALQSARESWEPESTVNNLSLIREAWAPRGDDVDFLDEASAALTRRASELAAGK